MCSGVMLVLVVLVLLFGSVFTPFTILAPLPLSVGGMVVALQLTGTAVSLPVVIGMTMLMGIVHQERDPAGGFRGGARAGRRFAR